MDIGNLSETLGQLVQLSITAIAGIAGAVYLSSLTGKLARDWMRHLALSQSHILGGVLGLFGGALLLSGVALTGTWAALLGLIAPVIAASLGGQVLEMLYRRFIEGDTDGKRLRLTFQERATLQFVRLLGTVVAFLVTFIWLDIGRGIVDGRLPVEDIVAIAGLSIQTFVLKAAIIGGVLGLVGGALAGIHQQIPIGMSAYEVTRTILNTLRSIEPLIMGIVFVIWVGIGPFAGVLALTLHSIASLGKLYSEQTEGIDPGPLEAMQATGATWLQMVVYGVVPQVVPPFIAFTLYRWDINVRMSTIIGFVGGGGIGFLLSQQINLLRYSDAGVAVLAIAIVVSVLDYASATIRERMI
ncbi:MAG: ABC transporter permease subunit [Burkholderiales bacterium]|nr:ABC transporter permease subunit [Anaerolineae bacterium]